MSEQSKIQWTDSTVNFWEGCTKVSAGCANCYAAARDARQMIEPVSHWGKGAPRRKSKSAVRDALAFNRRPFICDECRSDKMLLGSDGRITCSDCGSDEVHTRRIFSLSLGDWLDDEVPIEWLAEMLDTIRQCSDVTWILCTKRPENFIQRMCGVRDFCSDKSHNRIGGYDAKSPPNHWQDTQFWVENWYEQNIAPVNIILLASVENQEQAALRIPELLQIPAACRGLSLEPLLGPVDLSRYGYHGADGRRWLGDHDRHTIDWLIIGGESGPNARPCKVEDIHSLSVSGHSNGVRVFIKQLGAFAICDNANSFDWRDDARLEPFGEGFASCRVLTRDRKGGDIAEFPAQLHRREFPINL